MGATFVPTIFRVLGYVPSVLCLLVCVARYYAPRGFSSLLIVQQTQSDPPVRLTAFPLGARPAPATVWHLPGRSLTSAHSRLEQQI